MTDDIKKDSNYWSQYDFTQIPYDDIVKVGQRTLLYRDLFSVSWLLGRFCNYKCSYCWPYARSDRKDHRPTELCLATIDEIRDKHVLMDLIVFTLVLVGASLPSTQDTLTYWGIWLMMFLTVIILVYI